MKRTLFVALLAVAALSLAGYAVAQTNTHAPRPYYVSPDEPSPGVPPDYAATASDDPNSPVEGGSTGSYGTPAGGTGTPSDTPADSTYGSGNAGSPGATGSTGSQGTSSYQGTSDPTPSAPDPTTGTTGTYGSTTGTTGTTGSAYDATGTTGSTMDPNDPNNPNNPNVTGKNARTGKNANRLPATAGEMPLIALIGVLAAGLFFALRLFRTRPIEFRG
jgi:hypothetical protein